MKSQKSKFKTQNLKEDHHKALLKRETQKYVPADIEAKWQEFWTEHKTFSPDINEAKKPFYNLMMFPYPSAEGLHVGNMYAFCGADVYARFMRMQGYDVLEPIGLDGFGIHSENYALKIGAHPMDQSEKSERNFYRQLHSIGNSFDWERTVETYHPDYYRWTQWIFIQMFKAGLAYRKAAEVNWCPSCKTVLSDEQVIAGACERCGSMVEKRNLEQWFFKITDYAERLLQNLETLDWTEKVKIAQRNWIGKSSGAVIRFQIGDFGLKNQDKLELSLSEIQVFTTRPDTLYGATFLVVAPEHEIVASLLRSKTKNQRSKIEDKRAGDDIEKESSDIFKISEVRGQKLEVEKIRAYVEAAKAKTDQDRTAEGKEKTGVFSGLYAVNPVNGEKIPVWIADYVLMGYGTGAIMAVPAHDERDFEFAVKYELPVKQVIASQSRMYKSYLMGAGQIMDADLNKIGISIIRTEEDGKRWIEIPAQNISKYEKLIQEKLDPGFWNEYVGEEIVFLFKHKDGKIERLVLNEENEKRIANLGHEFNDQPDSSESPWKWLWENDFYHENIVVTTGKLINSSTWNGIAVPKDISKVIESLHDQKIGKRETNYHLRDWLISRQRYWGAPIPMIYCESCAKEGKSWFTSEDGKKYQVSSIKHQAKAPHPSSLPEGEGTSSIGNLKLDIGNSLAWNAEGWFPVPDDQLPVMLPYIQDYKPLGTGKAPLASHEEFYKTVCPNCGGDAVRETDVCDTFLDSSWYFLRYPSTDIENEAFDLTRTKKWLPVDQYIGGAEHSVLHLLYSRFVTMVLHDLNLVDFDEPFTKFFAIGLIIKDGAKMSKSKGNIVVPDPYIEKYGADALRSYLMFLGPFSGGGDFRDTGMEGMFRFARRLWTLFLSVEISETEDLEVEKLLHKTVKAVTEDISTFSYNTALARLMELYNFASDRDTLSRSTIESFLKMLAPFMPHMTEEIWQTVHGSQFSVQRSDKDFESIHLAAWPEYEQSLLVEDTVIIPIQVNGKRRGEIEVQSSKLKAKNEIEEMAKIEVQKYLEGQTVKKVIYVTGKIINFVVQDSKD